MTNTEQKELGSYLVREQFIAKVSTIKNVAVTDSAGNVMAGAVTNVWPSSSADDPSDLGTLFVAGEPIGIREIQRGRIEHHDGRVKDFP